MNDAPIRPNDLPPDRRRSLRQVGAAVVVFFAVLALLGARGLNNWARHLPVSRAGAVLVALTDAWWGKTAALGFDEPMIALEREWLIAQDASPLLYPRNFEETQVRRVAAEARLTAKGQGSTRQAATAAVRLKLKSHVPRRRAPDGGPTVLVIGDSIMATIGPMIKNDVVARLAGDAQVITKIATGLARPDVFDWRNQLRQEVETWHYDYMVMMLGTNDSQDFAERGRVLTYGTEEWVRSYNDRIAEMMDYACHGADRVFWIGLPPMKSEAFQRKAVRINSWAQKQVDRHPCMQYVSIDTIVGDERGEFTSYLKVKDGLERVRMGDGIHVTPQGGTLVSKALLKFIQKSAH